MPLAQPDLVGATLHWLLTLTFAGRRFYFSSTSVSVQLLDGTWVQAVGGLPPSLAVEVAFSRLASAATPDQVSLLLMFADDVAKLAARGHDLAAARGDLALWVEGTRWEDRGVVIAGRVRQGRYGPPGEPVELQLEGDQLWEGESTHAPTEHVNADTWPNAATKAEGLAYPWVFGNPGQFGSTGQTRGSPAVFVDTVADVLLVNAGPIATPGANVHIYDATNDTEEAFATAHTLDGLGRTVTTVDLTGAGTITISADTEYWVRWSGTDATAFNGRSVNNAYEVLIWQLRGMGLPVDWSGWHTLRQRLEAYSLAGYLDAPTLRWQWLQANVLPLLPIAVRSGPGGVYPIWLDMDDHRIVADMLEGRDASRVVGGGPLVEDQSLFNEVVMQYALDANTGEFRATSVVGPSPGRTAVDGTTPSNERGSVWAEASWHRYQQVFSHPMTTSVVYDPATAGLVAARLLRWHALPWRLLVLQLDATWLWLRLGMLVQYTYTDLGLTERRAWVESITYRLAGPQVRIAWPDDPTTDQRPTD